MKLSKLGIVYACLCATVAIVACANEDSPAPDPSSSRDPAGRTAIDKAVDAGVITSDAAL